MTFDVKETLTSYQNPCLSTANITRRFITCAVALHWRGWFFFYKQSHKRMMVWSAAHALGFNQGRFAQLKNPMHWQWWFGKLALMVKCQPLFPDSKRKVYFLNRLQGQQFTRNWKIFESGITNDQLIIQCLEHQNSRLVLQAHGRQYSYWGRRPESGVLVSGDESSQFKGKVLPLPVCARKVPKLNASRFHT